MGRNSDDNKKRLIAERFEQLKSLLTVGDSSVIDTLAKEFGLTPNTIRYHLKVPGLVDRRRRYSDEELSKIALFSPRERKEYACKRGVTTKNLRDALFSWYRRQARQITPLGNASMWEVLVERGYLNFSSRRELAAAQLTLQDVQEARKTIKARHNLALRSPNYLYHAKSKRYYAMPLLEQLPFIKAPLKYLQERAKHISEHWVVKTEVEETAELYNNAVIQKPRANMKKVREQADSLGFVDHVRGTITYDASTDEETSQRRKQNEAVVEHWSETVKNVTAFAEDTFTSDKKEKWGLALVGFEKEVCDAGAA